MEATLKHLHRDNPIKPLFKEGVVIAVDKPLTWTSFDVVKKLRFQICRKIGVKKLKVGHAGTLDPLATGLLLICTGKYTKKIDTLQAMKKAYAGTLVLGGTRPSHDMETEIDQSFPTDHIDAEQMEVVRRSLVGNIEQIPPMYSAIRKDGERLFVKARRGETIEIAPRPVEIYDFDIKVDDFPTVAFDVTCSKGTYIRTLAYDFGKQLNSGAYLSSLVRTGIGNYSLKDAWNLEDLLEYIDSLEYN